MIVSEAARVLFVHVQKTGGSSVDTLLLSALPDARQVRDVRGHRHALLSTVLAAHPEYADFWMFGFVRNPWARLYSWHQMIQRRGEVARQPGKEVLARRVELNTFWRTVLNDYPDFESFVMRATDEFTRLRMPQIDYLRVGARRADFIGRTETLDRDLAAVHERLGLAEPTGVPRRNSGPSADYRVHYDAAMRRRVAALFAEDVRHFDYEF